MQVPAFDLKNDYKQLSLRYDESYHALWTYFDQENMVPCANIELVRELDSHLKELESKQAVLMDINNQPHTIKYSISASRTPNVYNIGGHLPLIKHLAQTKNRDGLVSYAIQAIDVLYSRLSRFNHSSIINIGLVQGLALGAGLEAALANDIVFAERKSIIGFPEVLFNMFPGMGGYSLVARKAGNNVADEMMLKGKQYTAEEAYDMGLVDVLVEDGEGEQAVYQWIQKNKRFFNGHLAIYKAKNRVNPITYDELKDITMMWVDAALKLSDREFSIMDRFIYGQEKLYLHNQKDIVASYQAPNVVSFK